MSATVEVPESQRLIAVSLGKIAASRGQKGGINLHKNLLVATVLHKARTAYMIQQFARQRASQSPSPPASPPQPDVASSPPMAVSSSTTNVSQQQQPARVEMREQGQSDASVSSSSSSSSSLTSTAAAPTFPTAAPSSPSAPSNGVAPSATSAAFPAGAAVSGVQVVAEDKENTPPPSLSPVGDAASTPSLECENRLHGGDGDKDEKTTTATSPVTHRAHKSRDYVSKGHANCLLKRRRAMSSDHENVSAPKVRIVDTRLTLKAQPQCGDSNPEPMQCDSPQISNLVNIFNASFAGLSGAGGDVSGHSVTVVGLSVSSSSHKLSDSGSVSVTCSKEMKAGLESVRQPLVLSV